MSWNQILRGRTFLGAAAAALLLLVGLGVVSLMLLRGVLPEAAMRPLVWGASALACFCGGRVAVHGSTGGALPRALAVSACVYGALWLAALGGDAPVHFAAGGVGQTCAVWGGGALAGIVGVKRRRTRRTPQRRKRGDAQRKRAVT